MFLTREDGLGMLTCPHTGRSEAYTVMETIRSKVRAIVVIILDVSGFCTSPFTNNYPPSNLNASAIVAICCSVVNSNFASAEHRC